MKKAILCILAVPLILIQSGLALDTEPVVIYKIKATLLPAEKAVAGAESLTWLNTSANPVSELRFHLYLNAFKNNRSSFMMESKGSHRGYKLGKEQWGHIDIKKIQIKDGLNLTATMKYIQPDDGNPEDQTVMSVQLPEPVQPQQSIVLDIDFYAKLPKIFARSGSFKDFFMVAQWFPKIGVLWNGEWNCHQYHLNSEFFADFGEYEVEITVPEQYVVGATGVRIRESSAVEGLKTYTYAQDSIHDFAWTACPDFVEFREQYTLKNPSVNTQIILLVHKSHLNQKDRYMSSLKNGIEFFSQSYGPYPYPTITLIDPAPGAGGAGGMEYPTLFTSMTARWLPKWLHMTEMVTIHEFGHGYWYGILGSNEFEEAWLDEGINTYSEIKAMEKYYGRESSAVDLGSVKISDLAFQRLRVIGSSRMDPVLKNSWEFFSNGSYGLNVYSKAGLMLLTLERYLGEQVMAQIMRTYYERWKFGHPSSQDFIDAAEEVSGKDLSWFFDQLLRSPDKLDYAVGSIRADEVMEPEGIFAKTDEPQKKDASAESQGKRKGTAGENKEKIYRSEVVVIRKGEFVFPQEILITFENGEEARETWDGRDRWKRFVYLKPFTVRSVQIDPDHKVILDMDYMNNSRLLKSDKISPWKWALSMMLKFQHLLAFISL